MITYIIQDEYNRIWAIFEDESEAKWFMKILEKDKNCDRIFSMRMWIVAQKGLSKKGYRQVAKRIIEKDNENKWESKMKEPVSGKFLKQLIEEIKADEIVNMDIDSPVIKMWKQKLAQIERKKQAELDRAIVDALIKPVKKD